MNTNCVFCGNSSGVSTYQDPHGEYPEDQHRICPKCYDAVLLIIRRHLEYSPGEFVKACAPFINAQETRTMDIVKALDTRVEVNKASVEQLAEEFETRVAKLERFMRKTDAAIQPSENMKDPHESIMPRSTIGYTDKWCAIWYDPFTRKEFESMARLVQRIGYVGVVDGVIVERWLVQFPGDNNPMVRKVNTLDLANAVDTL